ncbi:MAG: thiol:disulfide interchange protein DsbA/DsbL [Candidatus Thiodiazotropha sp. (ex Myrtea spinifera)]|nr:thiol:disulfide interchange protein DsbA/DsbL [Candidatus Thiodiazotropha sp. (ex Myrtea spinifera)]MCU7830244.1 thiol:disulfide interchange protein DsbA/DsbL [Candidatus Thiodiazotropha sp. (ex Myrtea sp. 'scaly one' KF741663)]
MPWIKRLLIPVLLLSMSTVYAEWGEGWDPIDPPIATSVPDGKVEVVEFFWYGCPHCYSMEPALETWLKNKPENVVFKRVPSPLNASWTVHAQFYYAAEALGVTDQLHEPLFEAMHVKKRKLFDKNSLIDFAVENGVDRQKFSDAWNSFGVYVKVQQARKLGQRYGLDGVPAIGIDGKYKTSGSLAGTYSRMFEIVSQLVAEASNPTH